MVSQVPRSIAVFYQLPCRGCLVVRVVGVAQLITIQAPHEERPNAGWGFRGPGLVPSNRCDFETPAGGVDQHHPKYRAPAQRSREMGAGAPRDGVTIVLMGLAAAWEHGSGQGKRDWLRERLGLSGIRWTAWGKPEGCRTQFTISISRSVHPGGDDSSCLENIRRLASAANNLNHHLFQI